MTLLDRFGRDIQCDRVRPAMGFRSQMVKADEPETITGVPAGGDCSTYDEDSYWQWRFKERAALAREKP